MLKITANTKEVEAMFFGIGNKLPKIKADTVNVLGGMVQVALIDEMKARFQGGTSGWVLNSFGLKKATASNPTAEVFYNRGRNFMHTQVDGGKRKSKGAENLLRAKGVLPAGMGYLPGADAPRDQYGNLSAGTRSQVLSFFQSYTGTHARNNRSGGVLNSGISFFVLQSPKGGLPAGIYQRVDDPQANAMRAQRAMIAKQLIGLQGKGFGSARGSKSGKELRQRLMKELKATNKAMLPRGIKMVMAFDEIKAYQPLIKFYDIARQIVTDNLAGTFGKVAAIELGRRLPVQMSKGLRR
jgi:hypothetical protein